MDEQKGFAFYISFFSKDSAGTDPHRHTHTQTSYTLVKQIVPKKNKAKCRLNANEEMRQTTNEVIQYH